VQDRVLIVSVLLPFATALVAPWLAKRLGSRAGWLLAVPPAAVALLFARTLPLDPAAGPRTFVVPWLPDLGVELALLADGLSTLFVLLIAVIGSLIVVYAGGYLGHDRRLGRFFAYILAFMGSMLGVVLADNVVTLFVFWELTSVCSYLLIGFDHHTENGRSSALMALLVTGAGGLLLLAGLLLLTLAGIDLGLPLAEAGRISALAAVDLRGHAYYPAIFLLILLGCVTKSAQVPFHFWLPAAMAGPTPVSAFLHSATMVKAGVYLLARLHPALGGTPLWQWTVTALGVATMLLGAAMAVSQRDLKRILAFSTIAVLGTLTTLIGVGTELAIKAAMVFLAAHALYKAALFMVAGNVDHETGTRDLTLLGGLRRAMPWTALAGLLAAFSKAGAPPMFGFIGKELLYKTKLDLESAGGWLIVAAVAANVALVASALMVSVWPFLGRRGTTPKKAHEAPLSMIVGPLVLAGLGLGRGLLPEPFENNLGSAAASAVLGYPVRMKLALWHGLDPSAVAVMGLSLVTLLLGLGLFLIVRRRLGFVVELACAASAFGPARWYAAGLRLLYWLAGRLTGLLQTGRLRHYILIVVAVAAIVAGPPLVAAWSSGFRIHDPGLSLHEGVLAGLIVAGALFTLALRSRLAAVAVLGVTGFCIALLFLRFSGPDLAMTQVLVETLSVILLVLVLYHLPAVVRRCRPLQRGRDLVVAAAGGAMMTLLVLAAGAVSLDPRVSRFFLENSYPAAHGANVVNVILVDFRALDTLGEITVLAVAGLGIWAMLRARSSAGEGPQ
jgi:multicomponent Na+:H+ antiporter subunit A